MRKLICVAFAAMLACAGYASAESVNREFKDDREGFDFVEVIVNNTSYEVSIPHVEGAPMDWDCACDEEPIVGSGPFDQLVDLWYVETDPKWFTPLKIALEVRAEEWRQDHSPQVAAGG